MQDFVLEQKRMPIARRNVAAAVAQLRQDRHLGPLARAEPQPIRSMPSRPFNALVVAIVGQQISRTAAGAITGRLAAQTAMPFTPAGLASLRLPRLRAAGLSAGKAASIQACARHFNSDPGLLRKLKRLTDDEVRAELVSIKGVGPWTAEMVLMFGLGRPDIMPHGDVGVIRGAMRLFKARDMEHAAARLLRIAPQWAPHRTVAAAYLWSLAA